MSGIDKQRIKDYYNSGYSSEEEKYIGNAFSEESNSEKLNQVFRDQWEDVLNEEPDTHGLDHIIQKINYLINCSKGKPNQPPVIRLIDWYARIAAVLLIPLLVYAGIITYKNLNSIADKGWAEMSAPKGARIKFNLPDGSFGWLNSGSTLKYPLNFHQKREVSLTGQAFFDVKHQDNNKFIVKTRELDVEVKGTRFDVAAYADEQDIHVTLEQGSVILNNVNLAAPIIMKTNEQVSYNTTKHTFIKSDVTAQYFSAWKDGKLMLRNASLEELAKQLSRWYNVDVRIENVKHADFRYRATFEDENLDEVLRLLKISSQLDFKIEERMKQANGSFSKQTVILKVK